MKDVTFNGWKAVQLTSGDAEIVIPREVGPRVVRCGLAGRDNLFAEREGEQGGKGEDEWMIRGGHRLWHSPEIAPRTYQLDNDPIEIEETETGVWLRQAKEEGTGMRKSIRIDALGNNAFRLLHRIENLNLWPIEFAPWGLSVMRHGGYAAIPLPPKESHENSLLPKYHMVPWMYTDFSMDPWEFHQDFIGIDVSKSKVPQKLGLGNYPGWSAYWQPAGTFVVHAPVIPGARYPDNGCAFETFHCDWMIELETLGPLQSIPAGGHADHYEYWTVLADLPKFNSNQVYREQLLPKVSDWMESLRDL